ncbi:HAD family acid phosphatase [Pseudonocardia alaniniphila]
MKAAEKRAAGAGARHAWVPLGIAVLVVGVLAGACGTAAMATTMVAGTAPPAGASADRSQPVNLDDAKQDIRTYYGDHIDAAGQHQASADSAWARQVGLVDTRAVRALERRARELGHHRMAIVLDIDDTALSTYSYGANNDFAFHNTAKTIQWALAEKLPVISATLALARSAHEHGVALFFVTGRPHTLANATLKNLNKVGYPAAVGIFFAPGAGSIPTYLHCSGTCTTVQYKSGTRAHIESMGFDVIEDVGDQQSDLSGGHADATYKLPNPMYTVP